MNLCLKLCKYILLITIVRYMLVSLFCCNRIFRQGDAISLDSVAPVS
nr:MAG TPA: hypothetical protein [Microviridae sp.]